MEIKNLKVSEGNWRWMMSTKFDLGYKTADDLLTKMKELFISKFQVKKEVLK